MAAMKGNVLSDLVVRDGLGIVSNGSDAPFRIPLVVLPPIFLQWQLASRGTLFHQHMARGDRVARFDAHLPVVVTISTRGPFQAHTANKGAGLLPRDCYLAEDIRAMKALLSKLKDWKQSLREQISPAIQASPSTILAEGQSTPASSSMRWPRHCIQAILGSSSSIWPDSSLSTRHSTFSSRTIPQATFSGFVRCSTSLPKAKRATESREASGRSSCVMNP